MAEMIFRYLCCREQLPFACDSAAVSREETGNDIYPQARAELQRRGIPIIPHWAHQMTAEEYRDHDLVIGMDRSNMRLLQHLSGGDPDHKIHLLLDFAGKHQDVADPWYSDDFATAYDDILEGCEALIAALKTS